VAIGGPWAFLPDQPNSPGNESYFGGGATKGSPKDAIASAEGLPNSPGLTPEQLRTSGFYKLLEENIT